MAQPGTRNVHTDTAMTNVSIAYKNETYIATQVFPIVPVNKATDVYYVYRKQDWFRDEAQVLAPGAEPHEGGYNLSTCPYVCIPYSIRMPVFDQVRDNADTPPLQPDIEAAELATDKIELALERRVATIITTAANWTTTASLSSGSLWSADTSDPFGRITTAKSTIRTAIGRYPNTIVMGAAVWDQLVKHPDMVERLKYTITGGKITPTILGAFFDVERVLVGTAIYTTVAEGASFTGTDIWGKDFWIGWVAPRPSLRAPSAGYVIRHGARITNRIRDDLKYRTVYDVIESSDEVATAADAGYLIEDAVV